MHQTCSACKAPFTITDGDLEFYDRLSPVFGGKKYAIPPPTHCPDCRQQRRLSVMNERNFYAATCGLCGKSTITEQPTHSGKTVYCRTCAHGDRWDPCDYGRDVDFKKPFLAQMKELWNDIPAQNLLNAGTNVNSDYIHYAGFAKNCYLIMHADFCEDCYYGYGFKKDVSCVDGFYNLSCQWCYDCIDVNSCYGLQGCQDCINCNSSAFLRDCVGCRDCFLCVGLRDKEYCFENKQLTKEQYRKEIQKFSLGSYAQYQQCKARRREIEKQHAFKEFHGHNREECSGDYLTNCKDMHDCFDCENVEDGRYLYQIVTGAKSVGDIHMYGLNLSESYECAVAGNGCYHVLFCHNAHVNCSDLLYCWFVQSSSHCFGCVNMHHKKYCILNKQYTKEQYEELVPKIIEHMKKTHSTSSGQAGEWGEFFPTTFSPFGYNKTPAAMYYPLEKKEVLRRGWKWDDTPDVPLSVSKIIDASQLPDAITDIPDDILNWAVECEVTGKPFKITPQELRFYREQNLPIPRRSPDQRHLDRFAQRNPRKFWNRECDQCKKKIQSTYAPDRPEKVYCEECYKAAIV